MTFGVRAGARRATHRAFGVYLIGATVFAGAFLPLLVRVWSEPAFGVAELLSFLVIGALVLVGAVVLASVVGFVAGRGARGAAAMLRAKGETTSIYFGRLAPENPIVAFTAKPGELRAWIDENGELVALGNVTKIDTVDLTAQRIWGLYYYALEVVSADALVVITLGTRATWGSAEASRRAHVRLAGTLLGTSDPEKLTARGSSVGPS